MTRDERLGSRRAVGLLRVLASENGISKSYIVGSGSREGGARDRIASAARTKLPNRGVTTQLN